MFDHVRIDGTTALLVGGAVLGIANTVFKPVLTLLTLPLIVVTLGFFLLLINIAMVALAEWIAPDFAVDGFWAYVGTVIIVWLVNWAGYTLVDKLEPRRGLLARYVPTLGTCARGGRGAVAALRARGRDDCAQRQAARANAEPCLVLVIPDAAEVPRRQARPSVARLALELDCASRHLLPRELGVHRHARDAAADAKPCVQRRTDQQQAAVLVVPLCLQLHRLVDSRLRVRPAPVAALCRRGVKVAEVVLGGRGAAALHVDEDELSRGSACDPSGEDELPRPLRAAVRRVDGDWRAPTQLELMGRARLVARPRARRGHVPADRRARDGDADARLVRRKAGLAQAAAAVGRPVAGAVGLLELHDPPRHSLPALDVKDDDLPVEEHGRHERQPPDDRVARRAVPARAEVEAFADGRGRPLPGEPPAASRDRPCGAEVAELARVGAAPGRLDDNALVGGGTRNRSDDGRDVAREGRLLPNRSHRGDSHSRLRRHGSGDGDHERGREDDERGAPGRQRAFRMTL